MRAAKQVIVIGAVSAEPPSRRLSIGRAEGMDGVYVAVMHSSITLAPAVGLFATREILGGERDPLLAPYGLSRFAQ